ncbi:hypothetical protein ACGFSB_03530 [Streptomyces sp. NPDC048441]|uniref:hypothetical protein n=1 Tax=Streptomyces sp. NPDC048441 TaxID=3365552 RepID=UPI00371F16DF
MTQHPRLLPRTPLLTLTLTLLLLSLLLLSACAPSPSPAPPAPPPDDIIKAAQQQLTDGCLKRQGLTPPRPGGGQGQDPALQQRTAAALFGTGRTELTIKLPTGYSVGAHTDGCLAAAQRTLYGDQRRWFQVSTIANNLKPEAAYRHRTLASVRAKHRTELADLRSLRTHALHQATAQLAAHQQKEKPAQ